MLWTRKIACSVATHGYVSYPPTPAAGGGAREGLQVWEPASCFWTSVRSQDGRKKGKKSLLFYSAGPGVRGQDERDNERDKWKETSFFLGIQRRRLAAKGQPGEARFGPELDWEKAWRGQVFGDPEARERKGDREVGWD